MSSAKWRRFRLSLNELRGHNLHSMIWNHCFHIHQQTMIEWYGLKDSLVHELKEGIQV